MITPGSLSVMKSLHTTCISAFEEAVYDPGEPVKDIQLDDRTTDIDSPGQHGDIDRSIQDDIMYL